MYKKWYTNCCVRNENTFYKTHTCTNLYLSIWGCCFGTELCIHLPLRSIYKFQAWLFFFGSIYFRIVSCRACRILKADNIVKWNLSLELRKFQTLYFIVTSGNAVLCTRADVRMLSNAVASIALPYLVHHSSTIMYLLLFLSMYFLPVNVLSIDDSADVYYM